LAGSSPSSFNHATGSAFLSWVAHGGLTAEMTLDLVYRELREGGVVKNIRRAVAQYDEIAISSLPGRRQLMESELE
jgi:hypothetical protein